MSSSKNFNNVVAAAFKQAAELRGKNLNKNNEIKGDGIIMRPCAECHRLMRWRQNENVVYKCKYCTATYGHEFKLNHHMGLDDEGQVISQVGAPVAENQKGLRTGPAALQIGYGKGAVRMKRAQQYATTRDHIQKLFLVYGKLVTDTLYQLGIKNNVDAIRSAVVREFEEWYTRYPSRLWTKDTINHLAISVEANLKKNEGMGIGTGISVTQIASKMHEIYERDYKKDKGKTTLNSNDEKKITTNKANEKLELDKADKLRQRIIAGHQAMKQASNIASVLGLKNPQKEFIANALRSDKASNKGMSDMTLGYISSTFESTHKMADDAMKRATAKTTYPILLAVALRRHSARVDKKVMIDDLKATAKRHYRPILEKAIRMHVRVKKATMNINVNDNSGGTVNNANSNVCAYVPISKLFSKAMARTNKATEDDIFRMLKSFDDLVFKYGSYAAKATVSSYLTKNRAMLSRHGKTPEEFNMSMIYKTSNNNASSNAALNTMEQLADLAIKTPPRAFMCTCDSWSKIADPYMIDQTMTFMKAITYEYKRDLKNSLLTAGFLVDLLAFSTVLKNNGLTVESISAIMKKLIPFVNPLRDTVVAFLVAHELR